MLFLKMWFWVFFPLGLGTYILMEITRFGGEGQGRPLLKDDILYKEDGFKWSYQRIKYE